MKLSKKTENFINEYVLPNLGYSSINEDNIGEIVDYIIDNYEVPLAEDSEQNNNFDKDLLELATAVVSEITNQKDW